MDSQCHPPWTSTPPTGKENDIRDTVIKRNITDDCVTIRDSTYGDWVWITYSYRLDLRSIHAFLKIYFFIHELNCEMVRRPKNELTAM